MDQNIFLQAIDTAQELGMATTHMFQHEGILRMYLADTPEGERRRKREIEHIKHCYSEAIMRSRDERVRMQRELSELVDKDIWEPENCTKKMYAQMSTLRTAIAEYRAREAQYKQAKEELA